MSCKDQQLNYFDGESNSCPEPPSTQRWKYIPRIDARGNPETDQTVPGNSAQSFDISVAEDLGRERLDGCALAPGIQRQASLAAGLLKKSFPVPTIFDWDLGQQQAASSAIRDEQAVAPDFHCRGMNRGQAGEHTQRNLQPKSFLVRHRQETGIFESSGARRLGHGAIQRRDGQGITDASSKFAMKVVVEIAF